MKEPEMPKTKSRAQHRAFAEGYQEALRDIANALAQGGEEAAREWVQNNTRTMAQLGF